VIYVLGDSHADIFKETYGCHGMNCGAILAYTLKEKEKDVARLITLHNVPEGAKLLFVFGEIDVRVHLGIHLNVQQCVDNYIQALEGYRTKGYHIHVRGVIASSRKDSECVSTEGDKSLIQNVVKQQIVAQGGLLRVGTCQQRNALARELNACLEKECKARGIGYFSIFDQLVDADGLTREEFYMGDTVHLNPTAIPLLIPYIEKIEKDLL
jgi:hypothetical protein